MRYHSRQNPFTRIVMDQLQDEIEILTLKPSCPAIVRHFLSKVEALLTSRFGRNNKELQLFNSMKKPLFGMTLEKFFNLYFIPIICLTLQERMVSFLD